MTRWPGQIVLCALLLASPLGCGDDSDGDGDADNDSDVDIDGDADADGDGDRDSDIDADADSDGDGEPDGDADADRDEAVDADDDTEADAELDLDGDVDVDGEESEMVRYHRFQVARERACGTQFVRDGITWDYAWDGVDSVSDGVPNTHRFDSAIDDDWMHPEYGFRLNTPEPGFMSVDRISFPVAGGGYAGCVDPASPPEGGIDPLWSHKTGNVWRRDEYLSPDTGITIDVRVRIIGEQEGCATTSAMTRDAFVISFFDDTGDLAVYLSPDQVRLASTSLTSGGTVVSRDTRDFHTYRITRWPGEEGDTFYLYIDGELAGSHAVDPSLFAHRDGSYYSYPRLLIGDNSNDPHVNARYILDHIYYRRGVRPPGYDDVPLEPRWCIPLPPVGRAGPLRDPPGRLTWDASGGTPALDAAWGQAGSSDALHVAGEDLEITGPPWNASIGGTEAMPDAPGLSSTGAASVELVARVDPDADDRAFIVELINGYGSSYLALSPGRVELLLDGSPYGAAEAFELDTTSEFRRYRLVRPCFGPGANNCLYTFLYVEDDAVPAVSDLHVGGTVLEGQSRIRFGDLATPDPEATTHVYVRSLTWSPNAQAPPFPPGTGP